jgi:hypothetical protein
MVETKSLFGPPRADISWLLVYRRLALGAVFVAITFAAAAATLRTAEMAELGVVPALLFWCGLDARIQEKPFPHGMAVALAVTWPLGIGVYLVWTRGWAAGLLLYIVAIMGAGCAAGAGAYAAQFL